MINYTIDCLCKNVHDTYDYEIDRQTCTQTELSVSSRKNVVQRGEFLEWVDGGFNFCKEARNVGAHLR